VIAAVAGEGVEGVQGRRVPVSGSLAAEAMRTGTAQRLIAVPPDTFAAREMGARTAIVTPMLFRNRPVGFLIAMDRMSGTGAFGEDDQRLLQAFAASAAIAVATAQTAGDEALRRSIEASESERARWARDLHDETLQAMAGLRVLLAGARRSGDADRIRAAVDDAVDLLEQGIADLRALITDLRPAALDELGPQAALETLAARVAQQSGLEIDLQIDLAFERGDTPTRHVTEIESTTYRLVQEGLTNVVKHAGATRVEVRVIDMDETVEILLRDDGQGFDSDDDAAGFGLIGMRERIALVHGTLDVESAAGSGTTLRARIPSRRRDAIPQSAA